MSEQQPVNVLAPAKIDAPTALVGAAAIPVVKTEVTNTAVAIAEKHEDHDLTAVIRDARKLGDDLDRLKRDHETTKQAIPAVAGADSSSLAAVSGENTNKMHCEPHIHVYPNGATPVAAK